MKRAPELRPLSRDHHVALTAAQRLKRADDAGTASKEFLDFWQEHGRRHFQIEEEVLLPGWLEGDSGADMSLVEHLARDHVAIRAAIRRIAKGRASLGELHELGETLGEHVRFEERELFVAVEAGLGGEELSALGAEIDAAESAR